ncbi:MAG TPA: phosphoribosylformylglycinamidine cyclo-ligase [Planktothrix sp.]|jgi:phosphoribosylformylglycinamidine cyclo-ligase
MDSNTYAKAGVNVVKAEKFVDRLKSRARRPAHDKLWRGAGGYAAVVPLNDSEAVALTTDGVGTKLLLAVEYGRLETIGIDLVAMCANDIICVGATPHSFLDYYATPSLDDAQADAIINGIVAGADQAGMLLVGGETAELPGLYAEHHFDLAGFAMGTVKREELLTGAEIKPGDTVIGIASNGIHSNGLSLARQVIPASEKIRQELLTPTLIYVKPAIEALSRHRGALAGMANITGGGWRNLFRLNDQVGFTIDKPLPLPAVLGRLQQDVPQEEMYKTFNMGMGLAVISRPAAAKEIAIIFAQHGFTAQVVGAVTAERGTMVINTESHGGKAKSLTLAESEIKVKRG